MQKLSVILLVIFLNSLAFGNQGSKKVIFGIYLLKNNSLNAYEATQSDLQKIELSDEPLWNIQDFKKYKCADHSFELTDQAKSKIPEGKLRGLPFVFVANSNRIYLGGFWTSYSSFSFGNPVIDTELFKITGELKIARAYPHEGFALGNDRRAAPEIINELKSHLLLVDNCP